MLRHNYGQSEAFLRPMCALARGWAVRGVWSEAPGPKESEVRDSFYDSTVENVSRAEGAGRIDIS